MLQERAHRERSLQEKMQQDQNPFAKNLTDLSQIFWGPGRARAQMFEIL